MEVVFPQLELHFLRSFLLDINEDNHTNNDEYSQQNEQNQAWIGYLIIESNPLCRRLFPYLKSHHAEVGTYI